MCAAQRSPTAPTTELKKTIETRSEIGRGAGRASRDDMCTFLYIYIYICVCMHIGTVSLLRPFPSPINYKCNTTFSNGCLGSYNDEERSEMRYLIWIARFRNHQNFERTLRFQDMPGSMLGWVSMNPTRPWRIEKRLTTFMPAQESEYDVVGWSGDAVRMLHVYACPQGWPTPLKWVVLTFPECF